MFRRSAAPALALLLAAGGLAACGPSAPDPQEAADALAGQLGEAASAGDSEAGESEEPLDPFATLPRAAMVEMTSILGELAEVPHTVVAGEVTQGEGEAEGTATVPLTWTFDLGEDFEPYMYETEAALVLVEGEGEDPDEWEVTWSPTMVHPEATATRTFTMTVTEPTRGDIVAVDGTPIVTTRDVWNVGIDKTLIEDPAELDTAARALAEALELDPETYAARVASAGERAFVVAITIRQDEADQWNAGELRLMPGVLLQEQELPLAPSATWARPVLGRVGEATAEIIEGSGGEIVAGDLVGLGGLQAAYDEQLRGYEGITISLEDTEGLLLPQDVYVIEPGNDGPLVVTLDVALQTTAEEILSDVPGASGIAAVRPSTGEVLVLASGPGSEGYNTAALGQYPPGSTFKLSTALALLRAGYSPSDILHCTASATVDGRDFGNFPGYPAAFTGDITFAQAIAQSCNTALIHEAGAITAEDLAEAAEALGIGATGPSEDGAWDFPYFSGSVPADATGTSRAASLIGQGEVIVSPLAMAGAAASVAAQRTVVPVLVVEETEGEVAPALPEPSASAPLTADEAAALADMMRQVVENGTSTLLGDVPGEPVHAKSGTAEFGVTGDTGTHGWMIAYQGDLAVAAFVESAEGAGGAGSAGPLVVEFLTAAGG